jgi:hypothetical protein
MDESTSPTTPVRVKSIAKHLNIMSDEDLQIFIDDAYQEVLTTGAKEEYHERLTRYLAAHMASINVRQANEESVGPLTKIYNLSRASGETGKGAFMLTPYGEEYDRLMRRVTGRGRLNLTVVGYGRPY